MKYTLSLLLLFSVSTLFGQTKQVSEIHGIYTDTFSVRAKNDQILEGQITRTNNYTHKLDYSGFYKNNKKDSTWAYFAHNGAKLLSGNFKDDVKTGPWDVFTNQGDTLFTYNYSTHHVLKYHAPQPIDSTLYNVYRSSDTTMLLLDRPPLYLDGPNMLDEYLAKWVRYPAVARENNVKGRVMIAFKIDADGNVSNYRVLRPVQKDIDAEAMRVVQSLPAGWLPGILNGKPVSTDYIIFVNFTFAQ